jgi:hypothetical protein
VKIANLVLADENDLLFQLLALKIANLTENDGIGLVIWWVHSSIGQGCGVEDPKGTIYR